MYLGPLDVGIEDYCVLICVIPMLITATVECRLFAYFLLIRQRYKVINILIKFYKSKIENKKAAPMKFDEKIFFIDEFVKPRKTNFVNAFASVKTNKSKFKSFIYFLKSLINLNDDNSHRPYSNVQLEKSINLKFNCTYRIMNMQVIYCKLHEIFDLVSSAYGMQIIVIIAVQFITLTSLKYYFTMRFLR
jgi:hypothetical protein